jgi:hypothetical protein
LPDPAIVLDGADAIFAMLPASAGFEPTRTAVACLLANLLLAERHALGRRAVAVPLQKAAYTRPPRYGFPHWRYEPVRAAVDALVSAGLAEFYRGNKKYHLRSRIAATASLVRLFDERHAQPAFTELRFDEEIQLKNRDKKLIDYDDKRPRKLMRTNVRRFNEFIDGVDLSFAPGSGASPQQLALLKTKKHLHRIFNETWARGGRFYGGAWEVLPKHLRPHILIDGRPTVEIDFSALHPTMLYHRQGHLPPHSCYEIKGYPGLTPVAKQVVLIALNAGSKKESLKALRKKLNELASEGDDLWPSIRASGLTLSEIYDRVVELHRPIAAWFSSGVGATLQCEDATIMERVLNHFTRKGIACLPVHDSAIVQERHVQELIRVMIESYKKTFKHAIKVKCRRRSRRPMVGLPENESRNWQALRQWARRAVFLR